MMCTVELVQHFLWSSRGVSAPAAPSQAPIMCSFRSSGTVCSACLGENPPSALLWLYNQVTPPALSAVKDLSSTAAAGALSCSAHLGTANTWYRAQGR